MPREIKVRVKGVIGKVYACITFTWSENLENQSVMESSPQMGFGYMETKKGPIGVVFDKAKRRWIPASEEKLEEKIKFEIEQWIDPTGCSSLSHMPFEYMKEFIAIRRRTRELREKSH